MNNHMHNKDKKGAVRRVWQERFSDSAEWMEMVFSRIYSDRDALTVEVDGKTVSSLLLRRVMYSHFGVKFNAGYIYGAATLRRHQNRGYMSRLMQRAVMESFERGDVILMLKPARRYLYDYYARFGFSTVLYIDEQRYTPAHRFEYDEGHFTVESTAYDLERLSERYNGMSLQYESTVLHDVSDIKTILIDNSVDGGIKSIVTDISTGDIVAVAIAVCSDDNTIVVRDIVYNSDEAKSAALAGLKRGRPDVKTVIEARPQRDGSPIEARGMARIVNVRQMLDIVAAQPSTRPQTIRVTDPYIEDNCGRFRLDNGKCVKLTSEQQTHIDLDVSVDVLTSILFSTAEIGGVFGLATTRPWLSLMLD